MDFTRKISFLVFLLCVLISLKNQNAEINKSTSSSSPSSYSSSSSSSSSSSTTTTTTTTRNTNTYTSSSSSEEIEVGKIVYKEEAAAALVEGLRSLQYDYYHQICPKAEHIIRSTLLRLFQLRSDVAPALVRLLFHDCFIEGCDGSVLLDATDEMESEKESPPNESLKGFDIVDIIKSELEKECPGIVSCADLLVLAARESVVLAGGPFYPLHTGRRDGILAYPEIATYELPSPQDDLSRTISSFSSRGFDERETVALLGAHSTGTIHCKFFLNRLNNFRGTDEPDPTMDVAFMSFLRSRCNSSQTLATSPSSSPISPFPSALGSLLLSPSPSSHSPANVSASIHDAGMKMDYEGPGRGFGTLYYRSLLQGKGLLYVDQQLTAGEETETWVKAYAYDVNLFQKDFALAMMKLSGYRVLTAPMGQVRKSCRKVNTAT